MERHQASKNTVFWAFFENFMFIISFSKTSHRFWITEISRSKANIYIAHLDCNSCELWVSQSCPASFLIDWQCLKIWFMGLCSPSEMIPGSARSAIMSSLFFFTIFLFVCLLNILLFVWHPLYYKKNEHCVLITFWYRTVFAWSSYIYIMLFPEDMLALFPFVEIDRDNILLHSSIFLSAFSNNIYTCNIVTEIPK